MRIYRVEVCIAGPPSRLDLTFAFDLCAVNFAIASRRDSGLA